MKIKANVFLQNRYMYIDEYGVEYGESAISTEKHRFHYAAVEYIITSPSHELSFQAENQVFTIPYKPNNAKHQAFIAALVQNVEATRPPFPGRGEEENSLKT